MTDLRLEATRTFHADPAEIFAVVTDPLGHVDIDASGMLMDATGDPVTAVGDRFVVHMDREARGDYDLGKYDVDVVIVTFAQDAEVAWTIESPAFPPIGHVYGYRIEPTEDGTTTVTSYYDWSATSDDWKASGVFPVISESALKSTLGILERTVRRHRA